MRGYFAFRIPPIDELFTGQDSVFESRGDSNRVAGLAAATKPAPSCRTAFGIPSPPCAVEHLAPTDKRSPASFTKALLPPGMASTAAREGQQPPRSVYMRPVSQHSGLDQAGAAASAAPAPAAHTGEAAIMPPAAPSSTASRQEALRTCAFDRKLTFVGFLLHSVTQVVSLLAWSSLPVWERSQRVGSIFFAASSYLLPTLAPAFYLRWRMQALVLYRLGFFAFPLLRKARGIQQVMDDLPQLGARGVVKDLVKTIWGSRLMAVVMAVLLNPLPLIPLVPHFLLQVYCVSMVRSNGTLCATPLLSHPLTVKRIHGLHSAMHLLSFALPGGVGQSMFPLLLRSSNQREAECESFLSFLFYAVGLLLPMWLLVRTEPPPSLQAWEQRDGLAGAHPAAPAEKLGLLRRLVNVAEAALRQLCGRSWLAPPQAAEEAGEQLWAAPDGDAARSRAAQRLRLRGWERGFAWWLVLALLWAICVAVHTG